MLNITNFSPIGFTNICDVFFGSLAWGVNWHTNNVAIYIHNFLMQQYDNQIEKIKSPKNEVLTILCNHQSEVFTFLAKHVLQNISKSFIIISFGGDESFPNETIVSCSDTNKNYYDIIIQSIHFKHWFAVNKVIPDDKMFSIIPYGLDFWNLSQYDCFGLKQCSIENQDITMIEISKNALTFNKRIPQIYINWHYNLTDTRHGDSRRKLQSILPSNITYYAQNMSRTEYWKECSNYKFVLSPHGNGLDCIRTWEALCLGCIVIVKKSAIDNLYDDLPVVIVNEWNEVNEQFLQKIITSFSEKQFNLNKLTMNYWIEKINDMKN
jgi:hypothetical protein